MPSSQIQGLGSPLFLLPLCLLLLLAVRPDQAVIRIPEDYQTRNFKQPPEIIAEPESYTAFTAEDIILTCEAKGNPIPEFRWLKDGREFEPADDPRLSVSENSGSFSVVLGDGPIGQYQGRYRCYASNDLGTAVSKEARLIIENTPTLTKEKRVQIEVEEGEKVILHCNPPFSTATPNIHWMDNNLRHIEQSERVTKGLDGSLYFSHVLTTDSRDDYTCNAQYISARTILPKEPISLKVIPSNSVVRSRRPQILQPTGSHSAVVALRGHSLVLECIPEGLPTPSITWLRKDGVLSEARVSQQNYDRWLRFAKINETDDGEYQCSATNTQGVARHTYTVTVEAAPYWTKQPVSQLYAPGETVRLDCQAEGIPTPVIRWTLNGNPISDLDPDSRRVVHGGTLTLGDVTNSDTAVYQCEASNKHGTLLINAYIYVIELPPQILTPDEKTYRATQGQTASLRCRTFGSPRPQIQWERDGYEMLLSHAWVSQLVDGTLQIHSVSPRDEGSYMCSVMNTNLSISAQLEVLNRTVIVNVPGHQRIRRGQPAILSCEAYVDPQLHSLHPQTVWRKDKHKIQESASEDKYTFDGSSLIVANVQPEDEGVYTCEVITELDTANASGSVTVVDRPDPPSHLKFSDIQNRSLTLSWMVGHDRNGPITEFVVESEDVEEGQWQKMLNVSGEIEQVEIHLEPFWTYRFRVVAINDYGRSDPSMPSESHHTPPAAPDRNPVDVRSESTDPDSLVVAWKEMDRKYFSGPGFQYKVMWRRSIGHGPHWDHDFSTTSPYVVKSTGTFTPFEIKVQAVNHLGEAPAPIATIGYSGEDVPLEAPLNISTESFNSTTVWVNWVPVSQESVRGHLLGYKIHLRRLGHQGGRGHRARGNHDRHESESRVVTVSGPDDKEVLGGLQPYSDYQLTISAFNSKGDGPQSEPHHFKTPEGVPGPPASLHFASPSETDLTLRWTPPRHPNGVLTGYLLHYQQLLDGNEEMKLEIIDDPTVSHISLHKLDPKSYYRFYLRARTSAGDGEPIIRTAATLLDGGPPSNITATVGETSVNLSWASGERYRNVEFHVEYLNKNGGGQPGTSETINSTQSFYQLHGLQSGTQYELQFIFNNSLFWNTAVKTLGPGLEVMEASFATQGWFIGLISAIVLLLLVLLILCFIKRSKGGKYAVKDKEEGHGDAEARPIKDETLGEYSDNDEKHSLSQPSLGPESKLGSDDSLAGYGESMEIQFNEDGSFIGQYGGMRDAPGTGGHDSSGATSPVNPAMVPPSQPGVPSSVSALLRGN